jgi:hypothetical protein
MKPLIFSHIYRKNGREEIPLLAPFSASEGC